MSNTESAAPAGETLSVSSEAIRDYVTAVDHLLLDVPWRRRRELIADLQEHLREHPEQIAVEQPQDYAAELRAAVGATPGGFLSGFRSAAWPTPLEWCESVLRGAALILLTLLGYKILAYLSYFVIGDPSSQGPWPGALDRAMQELYPVPAFHGSTGTGLLIYAPLAVLTGQLTTAAVLLRAPQRRRTLRILSYVSLGIFLAILGYGAMRSMG
ncbi:hypothetical protein Q0Z83_038600 [Actinoplanes sichuanensis]|uniref:Uncharacterized protein n=1 Tax=Actinoplanes sichuanensis TaxID=512349 RepID=A0ABW4A2V4_9ACTN|nr:hypothetical protein [Actinoplanes sichuanensis]BEL05669.1 hypothetical protein Q0Z83_038600 [Actinoplanes sichuanensis]